MLVVAFAQPYIPAALGMKLAAERTISIFIDNSFSMEAVTREGTLLDIARKAAKDIAASYKPSDRFHLLTNEFDPVQQRLISRDEFLSAVDGIKISPSSRKMSEVLARQADVLNSKQADNKTAIIISDFQKSMADLESVKVDSSIHVAAIPVAAGRVSNVMIDSVWFTTPSVQLGQSVSLNVRIRNFGDLDLAAVPVKLLLNKIQKAVAGADIAAKNYTDVTLTFTANDSGWQKGIITIVDDPIIFDDQFYFSFYVSQQADIMAVNKQQPGPFLKALFAPDGYFRLKQYDEKQLDYSAFSGKKVIFLDELKALSTGLTAEIGKYLNNGGVVVVIPDSSLDFISYRSFFETMGIAPFTSLVMNSERVSKLLLEDQIFEGVFSSKTGLTNETDLPGSTGYFMQQGNGKLAPEILMQLRSGAPFLSRYRIGKGEIYLFAAPFSGSLSNFARHAVFVPVMYRIALLSEKQGNTTFFIGENEQMELPAVILSGDKVFHLINQELGFDAIPAHRPTGSGTIISFSGQVTQAGNFDLRNGDETVATPSFNYNRNESVMQFLTNDELSEIASKNRLNNFNVMNSDKMEVAGSFSADSEGTPLWKYCIILALLFLACEILLLKFWKK
jgi:hypothetical protein